MKKKRSEGFFGLHFDFHAGKENKNIGKNTTLEMITEIIDTVHPDFMQCDCKGHPGYASYATKLGNSAPGVTEDALKIWRKATEENDVSLYVHYSGVVDNAAVEKNPSWGACDNNGKFIGAFDNPNHKCTALHGEYADKILIPQIKELYEEYGIDGAWVDGECWGVYPDYSETAKAAYKSETGKEVPVPDENGNVPKEYINFTRRSFFKYLNHYVDEIHKVCPNMEIASNWAFSTYIPAPVCANLDYLSGDLPPLDSVNGARHEARYLSKQGKPWDLMAWSFNFSEKQGRNNTKSVVALCQEAAVVLAQGGGFQIYYTQNSDGSVWLDKVKTAEGVAKFCRERQAYCHKWQSIPQIAILLSTDGCFNAESVPFVFYDEVQNECRGIMECAIDAGLVVDVVSEHHLKNTINEYAVVIVPEWEIIGNKDELVKYAENGGALIIIGARPARLFEDALGVKVGKSAVIENPVIRDNGSYITIPETVLPKIEVKDAEVLFEAYKNGAQNASHNVGATVRKVGKGKAVGIYFDFGSEYSKHRSPILRKMLNETILSVTDRLRLKVTGSQHLELTLNEKDGKTAINLINTYGEHDNSRVAVFDEIPSIGPLDIELKMAKCPKKVTLIPQNRRLEFEYSNGAMKTTLDKLEIYDIIVVE